MSAVNLAAWLLLHGRTMLTCCCGLTHTAAHSPTPAGMGKKIRTVKVRKLVDWDKDNVIGKEKVVCTSKNKYRIHSLLPTSSQVFSHFQESRASYVMITWKYKCHISKHSPHPPFPPSLPSFFCWAWHHIVQNITLFGWGQLSWLFPPHAACVPPAYSLVG